MLKFQNFLHSELIDLPIQVLETLSKNCGDHLHQQIVERDVLHEMVKVVKKKVCFASLGLLY